MKGAFMESTEIIEKMKRLTGRIPLTDEDVRALNNYFLSLTPRELEVFTMRFGIEDEKPPFSKDTLEVLTAYLEKTKDSRKHRNKRDRSAGLRPYTEVSEEEANEI